MSSKSNFSKSTSKSYALALYELGKENSALDRIEDGILGLKDLLNKSSDFRDMILNPVIRKEEKEKAIFEMAKHYNFDEILKKFLGYLINKNRLFFLNQIIESFISLLSSNKGELKAKLLSSKELTEKRLQEIQKELSKDFSSPVKIEYKYEPELIGGLIIQIGSVMVDTSIKSKLRQLEKNMVEA